MKKALKSSFQYLSISYELALTIGTSLNLPEMLNKFIHKTVHKTNAHRGTIWVKNEENKFHPLASAGINNNNVLSKYETINQEDVFNTIFKKQKYVLKHKEDKDFLQYCTIISGKEESVLLVPVTDLAIIRLVYSGRETADEPLANLLASLSKKLSVAIEACITHRDLTNEIQVREKAEKELTKKTEQLISNQNKLQGFYVESEQARKSLLSILEDITRKEKALRESEKELNTIFHGVKNGIALLDKTGKVIRINKYIIDIGGYSEKEIMGKRVVSLKMFPAKSKRKIINNYSKLIQGQNVPPYEVEIFTKKSEEKIAQIHYSLLTKKGEVEGIVVILRDITERKLSEKIQNTLYNISNALNISDNIQEFYNRIRKYLGTVIDTTNFFIALYDEKTDMMSLPFHVDEKDDYQDFPAGKTLAKYVIDTGKPLFATKEVVKELTQKGVLETIGTVSEIWLGVPLKIENMVIGIIVVQSYNDPLLYTEKDIKILTFVSEEIALVVRRTQANEQIKKDLEIKNALLQELYHRTKNNMQLIASMLKMQSRSIENRSLVGISSIDFLHDSFEAIINRIKAMSMVHQKLYQAQDLSHINLKEFITDLVNYLMISYHIHPEIISVKLELEEVLLLIDSAIPISLVLNELISNVFKHAFPDNAKGEFSIQLFKDKNNFINIHLSDNGIGIPKDIELKNVNTIGLQTVFSLIGHQLKEGQIRYDTEKGLKWHFRFTDSLNKERV